MLANKKPWGHECIAFENENVAIWHLFIDPGQETSLHCHPNKKTGLVVLDGTAKVSFLSGEQVLRSNDKIMIRHGVFHRTTNIGDGQLQLFEIETPNNKSDLVRIKDKYNRPSNYQTEDLIGIDQEYSWNTPTKIYSFRIKNVYLSLINLYSIFHPSLLRQHLFCDDYTYMIVQGGVHTNGIPICGPGDVVKGSVLTMLSNEFELYQNSQAIVISKARS